MIVVKLVVYNLLLLAVWVSVDCNRSRWWWFAFVAGWCWLVCALLMEDDDGGDLVKQKDKRSVMPIFVDWCCRCGGDDANAPVNWANAPGFIRVAPAPAWRQVVLDLVFSHCPAVGLFLDFFFFWFDLWSLRGCLGLRPIEVASVVFWAAVGKVSLVVNGVSSYSEGLFSITGYIYQ